MKKIMKLIGAIALVAVGPTLFAYNGGYENSSLTDITIGGVTYKGYGNNTLTARNETGTAIAANRYAQCKKLTSVSLANVKSIEDAAFAYSGLTSVELPATLKSIGYIAFGGCTNLKSVTINGTAFMAAGSENREPFCACTALKTVIAKCAPPSWNFTNVFPNVTTVRVPAAHLSAWKAKTYSGVTVSVDVTYAVTLDGNTGSGGEAGVTVRLGEALPKIGKLPTRTGYVFAGYWTQKSGGTQYYSAAGVGVRAWDKSAAATLYAHWDPCKYVVTLVKYNGTADSQFNVQFSKTYNSDIHTWIPVRTGYTFNGWWTAKYGTGEQIYTANGLCIANTSCWSASKNWRKLANVTLYANWIPKKYTVTLVKYNNTANSTFQVEYSKNTNSDKHTWIPVRCGYTFDGWGIYAYGAGELVYTADGMAIPNTKCWNASCGWRCAGNITLYAKWIPKTFAITLVPGKGLPNSSVAVQYSRDTNSDIASKNPVAAGYAFAGWATKDGVLVYDKNGKAIPDSKYWNASSGWRNSGSLTVYAQWTPKSAALRTSAEGVSMILAGKESGSTMYGSGSYQGIFSDGTGRFDLLISGYGTDGVAGAYFVAQMEHGLWSEECEAIVVGDTLVLIFAQDRIVLRKENDLLVAE